MDTEKDLANFFRENILDACYFNEICQLQNLSDNWGEDYNFNHPHKSLGNKSPKEILPTAAVEIFKTFAISFSDDFLSQFFLYLFFR